MADDFPKSIQEETTINAVQIICRSPTCDGKLTVHKQVKQTEDDKLPVKMWVCMACGRRTSA